MSSRTVSGRGGATGVGCDGPSARGIGTERDAPASTSGVPAVRSRRPTSSFTPAGSAPPASRRVTPSPASWKRSRMGRLSASRPRVILLKRDSQAWQSVSTSIMLTERAAPFSVCTSRNVASTTSRTWSEGRPRLSASRLAVMAWMCSWASTPKVASNRALMSSFLFAIF